MSTDTLIGQDTHAQGHEHHDHDRETSSKTIFGFWIYLMSDCILFAAVFATYAVLANNIADGPSGKDIFELPYVLGETTLLLLSSFTYGMAIITMYNGKKNQTIGWLAITFLFGLGFIGMELNEFHLLISEGYKPSTSGFLSGFFTLVGTHGLHVTLGLIWMAIMMVQVAKKGLTPKNNTRLMCLSLFWHFLDVIWICVFTVVYLLGVI